MDPTSVTDATESSPAYQPGRVRLEVCPKCDYSLAGLPSQHRCPECGFEYDDKTFILVGISRGTSSINPWRKWLWLLVALVAWLLTSGLPFLILSGKFGLILFLVVLAGWVGLVVFLILTGKRERTGIERFIFTAGGFGYCADLIAGTAVDARMISWREVDIAVVDRKGSNWYRIRVGTLNGLRLGTVRLDVGVRCNAETAQWLNTALNERIQAAHAS